MHLPPRTTVVVAILVLYLGKWLTRKSQFLQEYNIPEPVTGGVVASVVFSLLFVVFGLELVWDLRVRDILLVVFFTTIGLSSQLRTLLAGGRALALMTGLAVGFLVIQNLTGLAVISLTDLPPIVGVLGGSVSLSGGHGTAIAWAPTFAERFGVENAMEIGVACATFGLVLGGIVGGPLAKRLIERFSLESSAEEARTVGVGYETEAVAIDYDAMLNTIFSVGIAVGIGIGLQYLAAGAGLQLPLFVPCLFGGILVTNIGPMILPHYHWPGGTPAMALVSDVSLGLFLAMSLMSLELWTLADLAGPIIGLLVAQVVAVVVYARFVVFPAMRKDYDAAVMAAGYVGLGLGATPTAVANMTAVTERFGAAPRAFIVIPLVGAFFIDLANALVVQFFLQRLA